MVLTLIITTVLGIILVLSIWYMISKSARNAILESFSFGYSEGLLSGFHTGYRTGEAGIDRRRLRVVGTQLDILPECCIDYRIMPIPQCDTCKYIEICRE